MHTTLVINEGIETYPYYRLTPEKPASRPAVTRLIVAMLAPDIHVILHHNFTNKQFFFNDPLVAGRKSGATPASATPGEPAIR